MKTVTVIIPTYNREKIIGHTIRSVLNQDYERVEILIVDDGSTDATKSIVLSIHESNLDKNKIIRYLYQENAGACVARNRGLMFATGEYILFLDSDDLIKKTMLGQQVQKIEIENSQCSICDFESIDPEGNIISYIDNNRPPHEFIRRLISPHISTVLIRRDSLPPGLQWNSNLKRIQDLDFIFRYFLSVSKWSYVNQALFQYRIHDGERISDSYILGIQYRELRKSFRSYIINNRWFLTEATMELYGAYVSCLRRHQYNNVLKRLVPNPLKNYIKNYFKRVHSNQT